jgi:predicted HAD superfamily hydrolase
MSDLVKWPPYPSVHMVSAKHAAKLQARVEELERALENLCIHVGMGWETDEMLEKARAVLKRKP